MFIERHDHYCDDDLVNLVAVKCTVRVGAVEYIEIKIVSVVSL